MTPLLPIAARATRIRTWNLFKTRDKSRPDRKTEAYWQTLRVRFFLSLCVRCFILITPHADYCGARCTEIVCTMCVTLNNRLVYCLDVKGIRVQVTKANETVASLVLKTRVCGRQWKSWRNVWNVSPQRPLTRQWLANPAALHFHFGMVNRDGSFYVLFDAGVLRRMRAERSHHVRIKAGDTRGLGAFTAHWSTPNTNTLQVTLRKRTPAAQSSTCASTNTEYAFRTICECASSILRKSSQIS